MMQSKDFIESIRISNQILQLEDSGFSNNSSFLEKRLQELLDIIFMEYRK